MSGSAEQARFRDVMGHFATGVTVITAMGEDGPHGMTASSVCSVSLSPLMLLVCFDDRARTLGAVSGSGRFGVNVLAGGQADMARHFASKEPEEIKWRGVAHSVRDGVPVLDGALAWLACTVDRLVPAGDHTIGIGEVRAMDHGDGDPLLWYRGTFM